MSFETEAPSLLAQGGGGALMAGLGWAVSKIQEMWRLRDEKAEKAKRDAEFQALKDLVADLSREKVSRDDLAHREDTIRRDTVLMDKRLMRVEGQVENHDQQMREVLASIKELKKEMGEEMKSLQASVTESIETLNATLVGSISIRKGT